jgi:integral membrane protein
MPDATASTAPARSAPALRAFRLVAMAEATSWLLLIVATIVKYAAHAPLGVHILGPIHGALFVAYLLLALVLAVRLRWQLRTVLVVLAESVLPGGGFLAARRPDLEPGTR